MNETRYGDSETFLANFEAPRRSLIKNLFHTAVRNGNLTPEGVLSFVAGDVRQRLEGRTQPEQRASLETLAGLLGSPEARATAAEVIAWENLPAAERARLKSERAANYRTDYMKTQPPTEAQLAYLRKLGHRGEAPADREMASRMIDNLQTQGRES